MTYPNVPLQRGVDWDRKVAQATNYLLNQVWYYPFVIEGVPDAGQELVDTEWPIPLKLNSDACVIQLRDIVGIAPTADAVFDISVSGVSIGTATIPAGESEGSFSFSSTSIPAFKRFLVTAPNPADATLSDIIISLAVSE